jgi:hypothetical protein
LFQRPQEDNQEHIFLHTFLAGSFISILATVAVVPFGEAFFPCSGFDAFDAGAAFFTCEMMY